MQAPWSCRVEESDASLTGIGRAWSQFPQDVVVAIARACDVKGFYTNVGLPWGISLFEAGRCPSQRVHVPSMHTTWYTAGKRWSSANIALSEADACTGATEDRLRRPGDDGCRCMHPIDSAVVCGAYMKGRSPTWRLNYRCRVQMAVVCVGGLEPFSPCIPSQENMSDEPSRRWEPRWRNTYTKSQLAHECVCV
jgi:hypothetical protein